MPIFEFDCSGCQKRFETLVLRSDEKINCPHCGGEEVKKVMSACNFKDAKGSFSSASGSSSCGSCSSHNCSSCGSH